MGFQVLAEHFHDHGIISKSDTKCKSMVFLNIVKSFWKCHVKPGRCWSKWGGGDKKCRIFKIWGAGHNSAKIWGGDDKKCMIPRFNILHTNQRKLAKYSPACIFSKIYVYVYAVSCIWPYHFHLSSQQALYQTSKVCHFDPNNWYSTFAHQGSSAGWTQRQNPCSWSCPVQFQISQTN